MAITRRNARRVRAMLGAAFLAASVQAVGAEWSYAAGIDAGWQEVSEHDGSTQLVEEQGFLYGLSGALKRSDGAWRRGVHGTYQRSALDYDGATQFGAPVQTDTDWVHTTLGASFGRDLVPGLHLGGSVELQWRDRDIASTAGAAGLEERYRAVWAGVVAEVKPHASTRVELEGGCALESEVDVSFDTDLDQASLTVDEHCRVRAAARIDVGAVGPSAWFIKPFLQWERYPRTDAESLTAGGVPVGQVYLPETEFLTLGVTFGARRGR